MKRSKRLCNLIILFLVFTLCAVIPNFKISGNNANAEEGRLVTGEAGKYDVVVYGATSAGIVSAIAAKREGANVLLIAQTSHLGGLTSSGLGATDMANVNVVGGVTREFYHRVYVYYHNNPTSWTSETEDEYYTALSTSNNGKVGCYGGRDDVLEEQWVFEPKVALQIFTDMLIEDEVPVIFNEPLKLENGVSLSSDGKISKITSVNEKEFTAKVFVDCSYEGDLMALSGVSYATGREANSKYGETMNGILPNASEYQAVSPYIVEGDPDSGLLPFIEDKALGYTGDGDSRTQAYCFRFTLTTDKNNMLPITKPDNYHPEWFETRARILQKNPKVGNELTQNRMPNNKTDTNHADFVGMSYEYANGDYLSRKKIEDDHKDYVLGLLYFYAYDERVPLSIRIDMRKYGLAKDEFTDNGNFPVQIYLREGRRMVADYVMKESDVIQTSVAGVIEKTTAPNSVGQGFYWFDSHRVAYFTIPSSLGAISQTDGNFWAQRRDYPISYQSIVPAKGECGNLFVPVCLSSTHAAYGSIRMETTYMIVGESAGTAAAMSASKMKTDAAFTVQDLPYSELAIKLSANGQLLGDIVSDMESGELAILKLSVYGLVENQNLLYSALQDGIDTEEEVLAVKDVFVKSAQRIKVSATAENALDVLVKYKIIGNKDAWAGLFGETLPPTLSTSSTASIFSKIVNFFDTPATLGYISDWVEYFYRIGTIDAETRDYFDDNAISGGTCDGQKTYKLLLSLARAIDANVNSGESALKLFETLSITGNRALWETTFEGNAERVSGSNLNGLLKNTYKYMINNEKLWKDIYIGVSTVNYLESKGIIAANAFNEVLKATREGSSLDANTGITVVLNSAKYFDKNATSETAISVLTNVEITVRGIGVCFNGTNIGGNDLKAFLLSLEDAIRNGKITEPLTATMFAELKELNIVSNEDIEYFIENAVDGYDVNVSKLLVVIDKTDGRNALDAEELALLDGEDMSGKSANVIIRKIIAYVSENNQVISDGVLNLFVNKGIVAQSEINGIKKNISTYGNIATDDVESLFFAVARYLDGSTNSKESTLELLYNLKAIDSVAAINAMLENDYVSGNVVKIALEKVATYVNGTFTSYEYLRSQEVITIDTENYFVRNGNDTNILNKAQLIDLLLTFANKLGDTALTDVDAAIDYLAEQSVIGNATSWKQIVATEGETVIISNLTVIVKNTAEQYAKKITGSVEHDVLSDELLTYFAEQGFIKDNTSYNKAYFKAHAQIGGGTINQSESKNMLVRAFRKVTGNSNLANSNFSKALNNYPAFTFDDTDDATVRAYWYACFAGTETIDGESLRVLMNRIYDYLEA